MRCLHAAGFVTTLVMMTSAAMAACVRRSPSEFQETDLARTLNSMLSAAPEVIGQASTNRLSRTELESAAATTLADAIVRLRPSWLRGSARAPLQRESAPAVFVDEVFAGNVDELRRIPLDRVAEVQFLTASRGFERFGHTCRCAGGVVLVTNNRDQ